MNNKWIKFPKEIDEPDIDIVESEEYKDLLKEYSHLSDDKCEAFINKLYMLRKESLINDGEYGKGNLIFNIPHLLQWLSLRSPNHLPQSTLERPQSQFVLNLPWHSVA